jgi:dimethylamine/trimethylamine dehydrogenase
VTLVTPAATVSSWSDHTMEQHRVHARLLEVGVRLETSTALVSAAAGGVRLACAYTGAQREIECDALVLVTGRLPHDAIATELAERPDAPPARAVGDAFSPGTIAAAVWDGRRYAEELDAPPGDADAPPFRREVVELERGVLGSDTAGV